MFGVGLPELIILFVLASIFLIPVAIIILIVVLTKNKKQYEIPQNAGIYVSPPNRMPRRENNDIADQLRNLGELRNQGVLSEEEFQRKKTELLSRL